MGTLPRNIKTLIAQKKGKKDEIGTSNAKVILFDTMVLKISINKIHSKREHNALKLLEGIIPVPKVIKYHETKRYSYLLMERCFGKPLFQWPVETAIYIACQGLKLLWEIQIEDLILGNQKTDMDTIRYNVQHHSDILVSNADEGTFTPNGFKDPQSLLNYLETNYPIDEPVVLSHGDFSLPNVLYDGEKITAMIDFGYIGYFPKERDISTLLNSLIYNYGEHPNYLSWIEKHLGYAIKKDIIEYFQWYDKLI